MIAGHYFFLESFPLLHLFTVNGLITDIKVNPGLMTVSFQITNIIYCPVSMVNSPF